MRKRRKEMIAVKLTFFGTCKEALEFYTNVFGGEIIEKKIFGEYAEQFPTDLSETAKNYIYSAMLRVPDSNGASYINMGDSPVIVFCEDSGNKGCHDNIIMDVKLDSVNDVERIFENFSQDSAKCNIALCEKDGYEKYASFIDRFGVCWNVFC